MRNDLTVIYYTSNREKEEFEKKIRDRLLKTINKIPLISVSQKPLEGFGTNICVGNVGISEFNLYKQLYIGCKSAKTKFIATAEADCLYPPTGYFDFVPEDELGAYFYTNLYIMWKGYRGFRQKSLSLCAMFVNREEILKRLEGCLGHYTRDNRWRPDLKKAPFTLFHRRKGMKFFNNDYPCINIKTGDGTRWRTQSSKIVVEEIPFWGKADGLQKELFNLDI